MRFLFIFFQFLSGLCSTWIHINSSKIIRLPNTLHIYHMLDTLVSVFITLLGKLIYFLWEISIKLSAAQFFICRGNKSIVTGIPAEWRKSWFWRIKVWCRLCLKFDSWYLKMIQLRCVVGIWKVRCDSGKLFQN